MTHNAPRSGLARTIITLTLILAFISSNQILQTHAAAGDIDTSFGTGGRVISDVSMNFDEAHAVAVQSDGKIVVAGFAQPSEDDSRDFAVLRYGSTGAPDSSFGSEGRVLTDFFGGLDEADAVAIQPDGKIVVAGEAQVFNGNAFEFALARYNPNGSLDKTFGDGGKTTTNIIFASRALAIALQPDGKIIAAGFTTNLTQGPDMAIARYKTNGSLDQDFGTNGTVTTDFTGGTDIINALTLQSDGKIVAAGLAQATPTPFSFDFAVVRYDTGGHLDDDFGMGGKVMTDFASDSKDQGRGVVVQSNGRIVVAGQTEIDSVSSVALAGYKPDGSIDDTFGFGGKVITTTLGISAANCLLLQPDDKLVTAGFTVGATLDFAVLRYFSSGMLDPSFGSGGAVTTDFQGGPDEALALAYQPDGRIIAVGSTELTPPFATRDFATARYNGDNTFDFCIQDDGNGSVLKINTTTGEYQFSNCSGLLVSGTAYISRKAGTITLQQNGPDRRLVARIDGGTHKANATLQLFPQGTYLLTDRNTLNNTCSCGAH
jgi:uncharacterized delta-60 repeat protein